ncbi:MAG: hemolysin family protein, partial [Bacillota bacterium]|nr:hemolysin family protein [Bacillota bacterium]
MIWQLLLQVVLIIINAVFACAEIAVISMNDNKLEKLAATKDKRAIRLMKLTEQPARFLATIQVGITLAGFLASAFAADNFSEYLTHWLIGLGVGIPASTIDAISVVVITLILSFFTLVLGELVPKRIAMRKAESLALKMSGLVYVISKIFAPVVALLTVSTNGLLRLMGIDPNAEDDVVTEEEIRMMVDAGSEKGTIQKTEKDFIQNVFEFDNTSIEEIMTHRTETDFLWLEDDDDAWKEKIVEACHSVYPICHDTPDNIKGLLYSKDYFRLKDKSRSNILKNAVRPAVFVPEGLNADKLFYNMKKSRNHFAIVLDEYGGVSGIVTMKDLLEELVGELEDDYQIPEEQPQIMDLGNGAWIIRGTAQLDDVSKALGVMLPDEEYD